MEISLIYILIAAEFLLILLGLSITFAVLLMRKPKQEEQKKEDTLEDAEAELDGVDLSTSYIDFLDQAMQRNTAKISQQQSIEEDIAKEGELAGTPEENTESNDLSPAPDEQQSELLQAREQFLLIEKAAAEKTEHEIHFWENLYAGMQGILDNFKTTETITNTETVSVESVDIQTESKEKVFYIETQGKKIDGEVNKLKDIISEQENALSSLQKAIHEAEGELPEDSPSLAALKEQIAIIERQLSDSKMCMEVLELENDRLQQEVDLMDNRHDALFEGTEAENNEEKENTVDLEQMKEVVAKQESKIQHLIDTIESLEIEASQADKLKDTLKDFTRTSQEMMSCITILEEENERLQEAAHTEDSHPEQDAEDVDVDAIKNKVTALEEELIKKDVAYAKLQDEFSSMETEYLAMYEAMHGDNS